MNSVVLWQNVESDVSEYFLKSMNDPESDYVSLIVIFSQHDKEGGGFADFGLPITLKTLGQYLDTNTLQVKNKTSQHFMQKRLTTCKQRAYHLQIS
jgi:hypothetical protein